MESMMKNPVLEAILNRRSIRSFTGDKVRSEEIAMILEAGRWAPSGQNHQPWRFVIVESREKKEELSGFTHYTKVIRTASVCVAVFLDRAACYHPVKDAQGAGACLQNMLLAVYALGLGAVWLGEILKNSDGVRGCLGLGEEMELQAVMAIGYPKSSDQKSERRPLAELIVGRFSEP